jgi:hypothetical protein
VEPVGEPSLLGLGLTFGAPDLATPPTAGSVTRFELPVAREAIALLPARILIGTRWDRLDGSAPGASSGAADADPGTTAATDPTPPDLVVPEVPGEVVAPVAASRLKTGGLGVKVRVPATPGLYRLVATIHDTDGLAFDAATQALVPALVVRVTGPQTAFFAVPATALARVRQPLDLSIGVANLGGTAWGHAAVVPQVGDAEMEPAARATLVARWVALGSGEPGATTAATSTTILPAGMAPGASMTVAVTLTAPTTPGEYLVVLDVVDPAAGSLAALGVPPGIIRVTVTS